MDLRLAALALIGVGCACSEPLWLSNGLDIPVEVDLEGERILLPADSQVEVDLRPGVHQVVVTTLDGRELDRTALRILRAKRNCAFYAVLGATAYTAGNIFYAPINSGPFITTESPYRIDTYVNQRFQNVTNIDFCMKDPPGQINDVDRSKRRDERRYLVRNGGWRRVNAELKDPLADPASVSRKQIAFLEAVVAAQPEVEESRELLAKLKEPPPTKPQFDWVTYATPQVARAVQLPEPTGGCATLCEFKNGGAPIWEKAECLSRPDDFRFVASDCTTFVVVDRVGRNAANPIRWQDAVLVRMYRAGVLAKEVKAGELIRNEDALRPSGGGFTWLKEPPTADAALRQLELITFDQQRHKIAIDL